MSEIIWAGVPLSSLGGMIIEKHPQTNRPERKVDRYAVPGRNGEIVVMQDAWENVARSYALEVYGRDYDEASAALMAWLYAPSGYQRLEDDFDAEVFRRAFVSEGTKITNLAATDGRCTVEFECDPRRFLKTGEEAVMLSGTGEITNPTSFTARPIMTVHGSGSGTITAGGNTMTISAIYDGMIIDCDRQDAEAGVSNGNNLISGVFPVIPGGVQTITITGGITSIEVVPNWWSL